MFLKLKILYAFFIVHGTLYVVHSFSQSYNFKNYSAEQGLPFVQVYAIFQDSKGNLWTGGYGGLSKFDGKTFTNYSPKNGLANHWVTSIAEDREGNIWVGTISGISKLEGRNFVTFTKQHGLSGEYINSLATDRNGNLWIATTEGITIYDGKIFTSLTQKNGLNVNNISLIYADKGGNIWMSSDGGVSKIVFNQKIPQDQSFDNYTVVNGIYNSPITCITEDGRGNMWFGSKSGALRFDGLSNKLFTTENGLSDNEIQALAKDERSDDIWVGTQKGLNKISPLHLGGGEGGGVATISSYRVSDVQSGNKVGKLFVDEEENLWIGTQNGLYRFRDRSFLTFSEKDGLYAPFIFPIFRDSKKKLWVGTYDGGFYRYDGREFEFFSEKDGILGTQMFSGAEDKEGNIWMGTNKGISIFNGKSFKKFSGKKDGLKSDSVTSIIQDRKGRIWLGGNKGGTIYTPPISPLSLGEGSGARRTGKFKTFSLKSADGQNFDVWYQFEDSKGYIWLGTYLGGLFRYDPKKDIGSVEAAIENFSQKLNLKSKTFLAIDEDRDGNIYLGSLDGVHIYNGASGKISSISENEGLSSDLIYVMAFDSAYQTLYIGTNQGVNKFEADEYKRSGKIILENYGLEEGLSSLETNSNGIWRDADGTFWFGTVNGLIHFDPYAIHINRVESKTSISRIRIFYNDTVLPQNAALPYYLNNIAFEYIGVCLTNPEKVKYKFMLEGYDKKWSPETKETFARYSNLAPGDYVFKIISCNNEGLWNKDPVSFAFSVLPPVWRTWWFRISMSAAAIILIVLFSRMRAKSIRRKEAEKLNREIQLANNELKALRAQMDPHFIFNSLSSIQSFIMSKDEESALRYLNKFAKLMRMILSNSEKPSVTIREEVDSLRLYLELEALRWENKFKFFVNIESTIEVDFHKIPSMLIQPFVENAILHGVVPKEAGQGKIEVNITQNNTYILCTISDNGIGRKRSQEIRARSGHQRHKSMGVKITSDRLEVINRMQHSDLSVKMTDLEDDKGNALGTKVEIFIPIS
ncbi:MAG: hypothetical protein EPN85_08090 [Bacteroidetes bacterium]|nr:MAG: hypothetical protein EPN85_08090 [Bacteroidota bacterium]